MVNPQYGDIIIARYYRYRFEMSIAQRKNTRDARPPTPTLKDATTSAAQAISTSVSMKDDTTTPTQAAEPPGAY